MYRLKTQENQKNVAKLKTLYRERHVEAKIRKKQLTTP